MPPTSPTPPHMAPTLDDPAGTGRLQSGLALAAATPEDLEPQIQSTGFFRAKSRSLIGMATALVERRGGRVKVVRGDPRLVKVTTAEDLELAGWWLDRQPNA